MIDRRRHGDDEDFAAVQVGPIIGDRELDLGELFGRNLIRGVEALAERRHAGSANIETDHVIFARERDRQGKPDVPKTNDRDFHLLPNPLARPAIAETD